MATTAEMLVRTPRQEREIDYHRDYAERHVGMRVEPVGERPLTSNKRRRWNAFWEVYWLCETSTLPGNESWFRVVALGTMQ